MMPIRRIVVILVVFVSPSPVPAVVFVVIPLVVVSLCIHDIDLFMIVMVNATSAEAHQNAHPQPHCQNCSDDPSHVLRSFAKKSRELRVENLSRSSRPTTKFLAVPVITIGVKDMARVVISTVPAVMVVIIPVMVVPIGIDDIDLGADDETGRRWGTGGDDFGLAGPQRHRHCQTHDCRCCSS